jgi:hypothetical protein
MKHKSVKYVSNPDYTICYSKFHGKSDYSNELEKKKQKKNLYIDDNKR